MALRNWATDRHTPVSDKSETREEIYVVSCGGTGVQILLGFLYPDKSDEEREKYHLRTGDARQFIGQNKRFIYLFEDPRNTLLALFEQQPARLKSGEFNSFKWILRRIKRWLLFQSSLPAPWGRTLEKFLGSGSWFGFPARRHFFDWFQAAKRLKVTFIRYDTLWGHEAVLKQILDHTSIDLPPKPPAGPNWEDQPPHIRNRLTQIYGRLTFRLTGFPDIFWRKDGLLFSPIKGPHRLLLRAGGMFWTVNGLLRACLEVDDQKIDPFLIDDSVFMYGKWSNFFQHPFAPEATVQSENVAHYTTGFIQSRRGIPAAELVGYPADREQRSNSSILLPPPDRHRAHLIIQKYLHLNPDLADVVAQEAAKHAMGEKLALHIRGPGGLHGGTKSFQTHGKPLTGRCSDTGPACRSAKTV